MASGIPGDGEASTALQASKAALALATLTVGETTLAGLPSSAALDAFVAACRGFGAIVRIDAGEAIVHGVGIGGLVRPAPVVGRGEDAFGCALLAGLAAGHDCGARVGMSDEMAHALAPVLATTGATIRAGATEDDGFDVRGARDPLPADHGALAAPITVAAAVFAGLNAAGTTAVRTGEPLPGCIEVLFGRFGVDLLCATDAGSGRRSIRMTGRPELRPARIDVAGLVAGPGRPS